MAQQGDPTIVGIGASAGGIKALQNLFDALPEQPNAAFVVVVHLDPEYRSQLAELLAARTAMPVEQIEESASLENNHVYVIPPNKRLLIADHTISARPFDPSHSPRAPIDLFFRSLAEHHGNGIAYGVILTGAGADGVIGAKSIKESGGIVLVQDPNEAEFSSMPRSAIAAGVPDFVLPVHGLAERLADLLKGDKLEVRPVGSENEEEMIRRILAHLRVRVGHDFSLYKRPTVLRRLARRLQITRKESLQDYYEYLRENAEEAQALFSDFLISVTTFFRDQKAFSALARDVIPRLFDNKAAEDAIRIWAPGCATGEEAYAIGILLLEEASHRDLTPEIQVFASDLDTNALAIGREGRYPATIEADVSEDRLRRFFQREGDYYRVRRELRDIVLFASHSLLRDPPFSRVDMISCRNLLIYLDRDLQQQVLNTFHYALNPGGFLFLGASESADHPNGLFKPTDRDARIFQSIPNGFDARNSLPLLLRPQKTSSQPLTDRRIPSPNVDAGSAGLHRQMLEKVAPPSMLIDENYRAIHLSDSAGRFLRFSGGPITTDAIELVREELRFDLRMALHRAFERGEGILTMPISVQFNGEKHRVFMQVKPVLEENDPTRYALVLFIEGEAVETEDVADNRHEPSARVSETIKQLQEELQLAHGRLRATREESEAANEELRAANEELQSINEEYRSTSEELETSKEELQSINEELQTVNNELKLKLESVSRAHSDLQNLMAATDFGTLFLDPSLHIKRFTPRLTELFSVTASDEGRPITDFTHQLEYKELAEHACAVLKNLVPIEREVKSQQGRWYLVRIRPYRTVDDKIDGVVATFVDITERRRAEEALRSSEERFRALLMASSEVIYSMSPDWKEMNHLHGRGFLADTGNASHEWVDKYILDEDQPRVADAIAKAIRTKGIFELEHRVRLADGSVGWIASRAVPILNGEGQIIEWFGAASDITFRKRSEEALIQADRLKDEFLATLAHELRNPLAPIHNAAHVLKRKHGVDDPDAPLLDTIQRQVDHLVQLVNELTEVSRISRGKIDLHRERIDIAAILRDAVETSKPLVDKKGHSVVTNLPKEPLWVFGDQMRLVQVVANLINNAAKYTPPNGSIEIEAARKDREAVLSVRDNGIGLSAETLPRIFDLFTQIESSAGDSQGGLGIGLALARKLVELHEGSITAHSQGLGHGSEFVIRLPLAGEPPASPVSRETAEDSNYNSVRVLVVDDQKEVGDSMGRLLESFGAVVRIVYDGPAAVAMVDEFEPDLIFLDIGMPSVDGYETARRIRSGAHEHPFILVALTGWGQADDMRRTQEAGFDEHLTKPASLNKIESLLRRAAPT